MKRYIEGLDRNQTTRLPDCVDEYVDKDNAVRAIDAFVDMLDLAALCVALSSFCLFSSDIAMRLRRLHIQFELNIW